MTAGQSTCASCGAPIFWAKTTHGKAMPVDAAARFDGNIVIRDGMAFVLGPRAEPTGEVRYTSHMWTCPKRDDWRKGGKQ
jgi:hypothetical protein